MSATIAGATKAYLEQQGLGVPFFRDRAPADQPLPFGVIQEGISIVPAPSGDTGDQAAEVWVAEQVQVSLFQEWRDANGRPAERYDLPRQVARLLHGATLPDAPRPVHSVAVTLHVRIPAVAGRGLDMLGVVSAQEGAEGSNVVHDALTLTVRRSM